MQGVAGEQCVAAGQLGADGVVAVGQLVVVAGQVRQLVRVLHEQEGEAPGPAGLLDLALMVELVVGGAGGDGEGADWVHAGTSRRARGQYTATWSGRQGTRQNQRSSHA